MISHQGPDLSAGPPNHPGRPAVDYPWTPTETVGVLTRTGFWPLERGDLDPADWPADVIRVLDQRLRRARGAGIAERIPVLGVGSNRSAAVLMDKFTEAGVSCLLALAPVRVRHLGVGHSAHVSRRGYLAATPVLHRGRTADLTMSWLDEAQLDALDRTEPNYERGALSTRFHELSDPGARGPGAMTTGTTTTGTGRPGTKEPGVRGIDTFWIYRSRWGLITDTDGRYLSLSPQPEVQRRLATISGLTDLWPSDADPAVVAATLAEPATRRRVRERLRLAGAVLNSGLGGTTA